MLCSLSNLDISRHEPWMENAWSRWGPSRCNLWQAEKEASGIRDKFLSSLAFTMLAVRVAELAKKYKVSFAWMVNTLCGSEKTGCTDIWGDAILSVNVATRFFLQLFCRTFQSTDWILMLTVRANAKWFFTRTKIEESGWVVSLWICGTWLFTLYSFRAFDMNSQRGTSDCGQLRHGSSGGARTEEVAAQCNFTLPVPEISRTHVKDPTMKCSMVFVGPWLHWFLSFCNFLLGTDQLVCTSSWLSFKKKKITGTHCHAGARLFL